MMVLLSNVKNCKLCNAIIGVRRAYGSTRLGGRDITVSAAVLLLFNKHCETAAFCVHCMCSVRKMYDGFNQLYKAAQEGSATFLPFGYLTQVDKECQTDELDLLIKADVDDEDHLALVDHQEEIFSVESTETKNEPPGFDCDVSDFVEVHCEQEGDNTQMEVEDISTIVRIGKEAEDLQENILSVPDSYASYDEVKADLEDISCQDQDLIKQESEEIKVEPDLTDLLQEMEGKAEFIVHQSVLTSESTTFTTAGTGIDLTGQTIIERCCNICGMEFGSLAALSDHQNIAHQVVVVVHPASAVVVHPSTSSQGRKCPICNEHFFNKSVFTDHMRIVHNKLLLLPLPGVPPVTGDRGPVQPVIQTTVDTSTLRITQPNRRRKQELKSTTNSLESPVLIEMAPSATLNFISGTIFKPNSTELGLAAAAAGTPSPGEPGRSESEPSLLNPITSISDLDLNSIQVGIKDSTPLGAGNTTKEAVNRKPYRRIIKSRRRPRFKNRELRLSLTEAEAPFGCTLCPNRYRMKSGLNYHLVFQHQQSQPCSCPTCGKTFSSVLTLRRHRYRRHRENFYECAACPAKFSEFLEFSNHKKKFHAGKVNCKECGKLLIQASLSTHRKFYCIKTSTTQICPQCGKAFKDLHRHIKCAHSLQASVKQFICEICGAPYKHQCNLNMHIKTIHFVEEEFPCEICGKKFPHKRYLEKHLLIHSEIKKYECKVCKQKFANSANKRTHYIRHHGTEEEQGGPFECKVCGQVFRLKDHLKNHKKREFHNNNGENEEKYQDHYSEKKRFMFERAQQTNLEEINVSEQEKMEINGKTCYRCELCRRAIKIKPKFSNELSLKFHKAYKHFEELSLDKTAEGNQSKRDNSSSSRTRDQVSHSAREEPEEFDFTDEEATQDEHGSSLKSPEPGTEAVENSKSAREENSEISISRNNNNRKRKTFKCNLCISSFTSRGGYDFHMLIKHKIGKRRPELECPVCKKYFAPGGGLQKHMNRLHHPASSLKSSRQFTRVTRIKR